MHQEIVVAAIFFGLAWIPFAWIWLGPGNVKAKAIKSLFTTLAIGILTLTIFFITAYFALSAIGES